MAARRPSPTLPTSLSRAGFWRDLAECSGHVREPGADATAGLERERECPDWLLLACCRPAVLWRSGARPGAALGAGGRAPLSPTQRSDRHARCGDGGKRRLRAIVSDGRPVAQRSASNRMGRSLPRWEGCEALGPGEFFLLMADVPTRSTGGILGSRSRAILSAAWCHFGPGEEPDHCRLGCDARIRQHRTAGSGRDTADAGDATEL